MNKEEIKKRKAELEEKRKALSSKIEKGEISTEDAEKEIAELKARKTELDQEIARAESPDTTETRTAFDFSEVTNALIEKRAITIPTELGGQALIGQIVEEMKAKTPLLNLVSVYTGTNAKTTIPLLYPGLAAPAGSEEGVKNITEDSTAKLDAVEILPRPFVALLPVSMETIKFDKVGFAQKLPSLFAEAFAQCYHKQIISGRGDAQKEFEGLSSLTFKADKTITAGASGKVTVMDLASLALEIADKTDSGYIILNPAIYSKILADSPEKDLSAVYLKTLIETKSIEGVKIILTSHMLKDSAGGKVVAIAGDLKKFGMGIAGDIDITPKAKVGDTNVYFEAVMHANGKPIINDFYALKAKA